MSKNYAALAQQIIAAIGGADNVAAVTHCMTRLRFVVKDNERVDSATLKGLKGVLGVVRSDNQCQVIVGNTVSRRIAKWSRCCRGSAPGRTAGETAYYPETHRRRDPRRADRHHVAADPGDYRRIDG